MIRVIRVPKSFASLYTLREGGLKVISFEKNQHRTPYELTLPEFVSVRISLLFFSYQKMEKVSFSSTQIIYRTTNT
jgi:hypothetical protein